VNTRHADVYPFIFKSRNSEWVDGFVCFGVHDEDLRRLDAFEADAYDRQAHTKIVEGIEHVAEAYLVEPLICPIAVQLPGDQSELRVCRLRVFVISDLHVGDRSPRDNLCQANRESLLDSSLRDVEDQKEQLVIIGDFLELLRYPLDSVIDRRKSLLDRLADMDTVYCIPGDHDEDVIQLASTCGLSSRFLRSITTWERVGDLAVSVAERAAFLAIFGELWPDLDQLAQVRVDFSLRKQDRNKLLVRGDRIRPILCCKCL
jgi:hypothetical protein